MSELKHCNPTGRFTGLAALYARCRPGYPASALDHIIARCGLGPRSLLVDVGCGTGISSRLLAERGIRVLGVEPNAEMRTQAEAAPGGSPAPTYCEGRAEATCLPSGSADAVLAAQAFHWFDPGPALAEFHRILKPDGWVALMWNERDESDPFTAEYGVAFRSVRGAAALEMSRGRAGEPLLVSPLFQDGSRVTFANVQELDEDGLLGRAFSASYAPREPEEAERFAAALREVFARHQRHGRVVIHYEAAVYLARRLVRPEVDHLAQVL
jgi:SAM-dependent methyltransferase